LSSLSAIDVNRLEFKTYPIDADDIELFEVRDDSNDTDRQV
jgi:hypothetical protein